MASGVCVCVCVIDREREREREKGEEGMRKGIQRERGLNERLVERGKKRRPRTRRVKEERQRGKKE